MKLCICGASGLVGEELCYFLNEKNISFIGTYNENKPKEYIDKMYKVDFFDIDFFEYFLQQHKIDICINLVVQRVTDICETMWEETKKTNIDLVDNVSFVCQKLNIKIIHLSTDYVFDGKKQPNYPDDLKNPLQNYGISKLMSEYKIQTNCNNYCIIRTPVLYSNLSKIHNNAVTMIAKNIMDLRKIQKKEDNYCIRRPLFIKDLCVFIVYTIENNMNGIYHFYNPFNRFTKYEMSLIFAHYLDVSHNHIIPETKIPLGLSSRPYDTQLMDSKYNINDFSFTDFDSSIETCFEKFKHPKICQTNKFDFFVLLDLDGTLINSHYAHYLSYQTVFKKKDIPFLSFEEWNVFIQNKNIDEYLSNLFTIEEIKELKKEKRKEFENQNIEFTNNSDQFISFLTENNMNCCIVTHTNVDTCEIIKRKLPLLKKIQNWITREDYLLPKPHSECYKMAMNKYYKNEKYIIGFEDTIVGYKSLKDVTDKIYIYNDKNNNSFYKYDCFIFNDYSNLEFINLIQ